MNKENKGSIRSFSLQLFDDALWLLEKRAYAIENSFLFPKLDR